MRRFVLALLVLVLPLHALAQTAKQIVQYPAAGAVLQLQPSGGKTIFGNATTPVSAMASATTFTPQVQILSTGASASALIGRFSADNNAGRISFVKSRSTSIGGHAALSSGDAIGRFGFFGDDGTDNVGAAEISAVVDGAVSTGTVPVSLVFSTVTSSSGPVERLRVRADGLMQFGSPSWTANGSVA